MGMKLGVLLERYALLKPLMSIQSRLGPIAVDGWRSEHSTYADLCRAISEVSIHGPRENHGQRTYLGHKSLQFPPAQVVGTLSQTDFVIDSIDALAFEVSRFHQTILH